MAEEKNNIVKETAEDYEYLVGDEAVQRLAFLKRKWELDYNSGMQYAKDKGWEERKGRTEKRHGMKERNERTE